MRTPTCIVVATFLLSACGGTEPSGPSGTLNDTIVVSEVATLRTGKVIDEMSVYRIENGLIVRDWFIFHQARP